MMYIYEGKMKEKSEQINLPAFKKKYKVKMRVRNAGRLQLLAFQMHKM
jgi:hypothetical protein